MLGIGSRSAAAILKFLPLLDKGPLRFSFVLGNADYVARPTLSQRMLLF